MYAQKNGWLPVYEVTKDATLALYPDLWACPVSNTTHDFNLPEVIHRNRTALKVGELIPSIKQTVGAGLARPVVVAPGELIAVSGAHLHRGIPNGSGLTRVSLESRTVAIADVVSGRGAANVDGHSRWMAPGWFKRLSDGESLATILGVEPISRYPIEC